MSKPMIPKYRVPRSEFLQEGKIALPRMDCLYTPLFKKVASGDFSNTIRKQIVFNNRYRLTAEEIESVSGKIVTRRLKNKPEYFVIVKFHLISTNDVLISKAFELLPIDEGLLRVIEETDKNQSDDPNALPYVIAQQVLAGVINVQIQDIYEFEFIEEKVMEE